MQMLQAGTHNRGYHGILYGMPVVTVPIHAPEFTPGEWLNSPPLTMASLRGQVVLIDFWNYTCVNCLRTFPYLHAWWDRYRDVGLMVVGIHTPEFSFEHHVAHVQHAVADLDVPYPVLLDNEFANWQAWTNRYWPTKYLVDRAGRLRFFHYGEGQYQTCEEMIQMLLRQGHPELALPPVLPVVRVDDRPESICIRPTPELNLGYARCRLGNPEPIALEADVMHAAMAAEAPETIYLTGHWRHHAEAKILMTAPGCITVRYRAHDVNIVIAPPSPGVSAQLAVFQDSAPLTPETFGVDVQLRDDRALAETDYPRMLHLVQNPSVSEHELTIEMLTVGTAVYTLTFLGECKV